MTEYDEPTLAPEFAPFWDNVARSRVSFPFCRDCGKFHWYPLKRCPHCLSESIEWRAAGPVGSLYSWTWVRHAFQAELVVDIPYAVALVEFDDAPGVRLLTNLVDVEAPAVGSFSDDTLRIGMAVEACFDRTPSQPSGLDPARLCFRVVS